jgi:hypothetical protein
MSYSPHLCRSSGLLKVEVLGRADSSGHRHLIGVDGNSRKSGVRARRCRNGPVWKVFNWRLGKDLRLRRVLGRNPLRCNRRRRQRVVVAEATLLESQLVKTVCLGRRYRTSSLQRSLLDGSAFIDWMDRQITGRPHALQRMR